MPNAIMNNVKVSPVTTTAGGVGLVALLSDVDEVHTPTGWVKFGIKAAAFLFMAFARDPWQKQATENAEAQAPKV